MKKILLLFLSIIIVTGCNEKNEINDLIKVNQNELIIKEQVVNNLTLSDITLYYEKGISTFNVKMKNNTENNITVSDFSATFKNKNGTIITTLKANNINSIDANSTKDISIASDVDLSSAYSVEYEIR